jgi:hypothetical protein
VLATKVITIEHDGEKLLWDGHNDRD